MAWIAIAPKICRRASDAAGQWSSTANWTMTVRGAGGGVPARCALTGQVYAYINRCVHMPRRLDGEEPRFSTTADAICAARCTASSITPQTGASVSAMCEGEQLRAVRVYEEDGEVGIADFRVTASLNLPAPKSTRIVPNTSQDHGSRLPRAHQASFRGLCRRPRPTRLGRPAGDPFRRYRGRAGARTALAADAFRATATVELLEKPENEDRPATWQPRRACSNSRSGSRPGRTGARAAGRCAATRPSGNLHPIEVYVLAPACPVSATACITTTRRTTPSKAAPCVSPAATAPRLAAVGLTSIHVARGLEIRRTRLPLLPARRRPRPRRPAPTPPRCSAGKCVPLASRRTLGHCLGLDRPDDFPPSRYAFTETRRAGNPARHARARPECAAAATLLAPGWHGADWQGKPTASTHHPATAGRPSIRWLPPAASRVTARGSPATSRRCRRSRRIRPLPAPPKSSASAAAASVSTRAPHCRNRPSTACSTPSCRARNCRGWRRTGRRASTCCSSSCASMACRAASTCCRARRRLSELPAALLRRRRFAASRPVAEFDPDCPPHLGLIQLAEMGLQEMQRLARSLSCHQDIASTSAFSLGMLGEFEDPSA